MVRELAERCKEASRQLRVASVIQRNNVLERYARLLEQNTERILEENEKDLIAARADGMSEALLDRLTLNGKRIGGIAGSVRKVLSYADPVGGADGAVRHPNGMLISKRQVPLGVVGVIYEARPNVTADVVSLCIKSGNAALLRGGRAALLSNTALVALAHEALQDAGLPAGCIGLISDHDRSSAVEMMGLTGLLDALIPRGGKGLIKSVVENAKVPVIETGWGNCHVYVDEEADLAMAVSVTVNAKCSRPSVCNAAETLLVARPVAGDFLPKAAEALAKQSVRLHCCPESLAILQKAGADPALLCPAEELDWETEYNDFDLAVCVTDGLNQAAEHINRYGSGHSDAIITKNYFTARRFTELVDSAAVYVNVSTRFTDGEEFGLGAEIGVSTQKLHVRGPMGLDALTTAQFVIEGEGQVRE
ncbi:MAG: glutamate-5-semialdehyde dehydrogenase [Oscillospiraceae bacterium]|jgi:glutamate-5-semialdehyde dehydrogenase|nr:glutamate-5-semialdehyde dehydrogenase [Oscillospiraceae bacterium]